MNEREYQHVLQVIADLQVSLDAIDLALERALSGPALSTPSEEEPNIPAWVNDGAGEE